MKQFIGARGNEEAKNLLRLWKKDKSTLIEVVDALKDYAEIYEKATAVRLFFENEKQKLEDKIHSFNSSRQFICQSCQSASNGDASTYSTNGSYYGSKENDRTNRFNNSNWQYPTAQHPPDESPSNEWDKNRNYWSSSVDNNIKSQSYSECHSQEESSTVVQKRKFDAVESLILDDDKENIDVTEAPTGSRVFDTKISYKKAKKFVPPEKFIDKL